VPLGFLSVALGTDSDQSAYGQRCIWGRGPGNRRLATSRTRGFGPTKRRPSVAAVRVKAPRIAGPTGDEIDPEPDHGTARRPAGTP
jgi:hypothetical protein